MGFYPAILTCLLAFQIGSFDQGKMAQAPDSVVTEDARGGRVVRYYCKAIPVHRQKAAVVEYRQSTKQDDGALRSLTVVPIDTTRAVGSIPYTEGVSPTGAKTISIPVATAPGVSFVPGISLCYNSQSSEGIAGRGWDLSGLPAITAIPRNIYYHGNVARVRLDTAGVFSLDGNPLVRNYEAAVVASFPLRTARGNIIARMEGDAEGMVCRFLVRYPDGSEGEFARTDSTQASYTYPLSQWTDREGRRIRFYYRRSSARPVIDSVTYGPGLRSKILFDYSAQPLFPRYYCGINLGTGFLLTGIRSYDGEGRLLGAYSLSHTFRGLSPLLTQVGLSREGSALNPLRFDYGDGTNLTPQDKLDSLRGYYFASYFDDTSAIVFNRGRFFPDTPQDGNVRYPAHPAYTVIDRIDQGGEIARIYGSLYDANQVLAVSQAFGMESAEDTGILAGAGFQLMSPVDIDGDGVDEVVKVNLGLNGHSYTRLNITVYSYSLDWQRTVVRSFSVDVAGVVVERCGGDSHYSPHQRVFRFGQFRGDGKTQLLAVSYDTSPRSAAMPSTAALIDLETGQKIDELADFGLSRGESDFFCAVDINGDGRTDIVKKDGTDVKVFSLIQEHLLLTYPTLSLSNASALNTHTLVADFNADGYPDFLTPDLTPSSSTWYLSHTTGGAMLSSSTLSLGAYSSSDEYLPVDVDNDGYPDLVRRSGSTLSTFLNAQGSLSTFVRNYTIRSGGQLMAGRRSLDRLDRGVFVVYPRYANQYEFSFNTGAWLRLARLADGYGNYTDYYYEELTSSISAYLRDFSRTVSAGFSTRLLSLPLLNLEISRTRAGNRYKDLSYSYGGCVLHNTGLGFCGFTRTITYDRVQELATRMYFNPEKMGVPVRRTQSLLFGAEPFTLEDYTWDNHSTTYGKLDPRLTSAVQTDSLSRTTTSVSYTYNVYGYPTLTQTLKYSLGGSAGERLFHEVTYRDTVSSARYLLGIVQAEGDTRMPVNPADTCLATYATYDYDTLWRPVAERQYRRYAPSQGFATGGVLEQETRYAYDAFGNVSQRRSAAYGATTFLEETFTYDTTGRYLLSSTDVRGLTTTYGDHDVWGNPRVTTDPMGLVTRDSLDAWGNLVLRRNWDGTADTTVTRWGGAGLYRTISSGSGKPRSIVHYDALGREVLSEQERFDGSFLKRGRTYDARGRLATETQPYKTAPNPNLNTVYSYDVYGRLLSRTQGVRSETHAYDGLSATTVSEGIAKTTTTDAWGRTVSVQDPGGTISYALRIDGQPDRITAPGGVVTTFAYDAHGRRRRITDPSAGVQKDSLVHYADGTSKLFHTNPNGQITTTYNAYGDVTRVDRAGEFYTTYTYDRYGRLQATSNSNGTSMHYYWSLSNPRPQGYWQIGPDWQTLSVSYTYNASGHLQAEYYNYENDVEWENVTVTHTYAHGHQVKTEVGEGQTRQTVFQLTSENEMGQPTQVTTGTAQRYYGYDAYGLPASRRFGYYTPLETSFDPATGNLSYRTDYAGDQESFSYDGMNRLTSYAVPDLPSVPGHTVSYASNGNIRSKGGYGILSYTDADHPYRVTAFTPENPGMDIPEREQTISYTSFSRPASISEGGITAVFTYDGDGERRKMAVTDSLGGRILTRYYLGGCMEVDVDASGSQKKKLYLGGDYYSAPVVIVKDGFGSWTLYNIVRDYQGSIMRVASSDGTTLAGNYSYDPWGRRRDPYTWAPYAAGTEPSLLLGRGWCGHEHLPWFGLINLNARLYDPVLGRFLSPDPYVQAPDFSQSFNRYSYCLNNPLKYTDQSGEIVGTVLTFVIDFFVKLFFEGGLDLTSRETREQAWTKFDPSAPWSKTNKAWEIDKAYFAWDEGNTIVGNLANIILRNTWEQVQMLLGNSISHFRNIMWETTVSRFDGVVLVNRDEPPTENKHSNSEWGMTLGNYVNSLNVKPDPTSDPIFFHEFGHTIQSRRIGPLYVAVVGIPSLLGSIFNSWKWSDHDREWYELDANNISYDYLRYNDLSETVEYYNPTDLSPDWYSYVGYALPYLVGLLFFL